MRAVSCFHHAGQLVAFLRAEHVPCVFAGSADVEIERIAIHSAEAAGLFVPLPGSQTDGHGFISEFLDRNPVAFALCAERNLMHIPVRYRSRLWVVSDPLMALQAMARAYRNTWHVPVIAITGSHGKTTCKRLLHAIFGGYASAGNLNNRIGLPLAMLGVPLHTHRVFLEMGMSQKGELTELAQIANPSIGIVVNVGAAHCGNLGSLAAVAEAKAEVYRYVSWRGGKNFGLLPYRPLFSVDVQDTVQWIATDFVLPDSGVRSSGQWLDVKGNPPFPLLRYGVSQESCALTMALAEAWGISTHAYLEGLKRFIDVHPGLRGSVVSMGRHKVFMDCYNASPESFAFSLQRAQAIGGDAANAAAIGWYGDMAELGEFSAAFHDTVLSEILSSPLFSKGGKVFLFGAHFCHAWARYVSNNPAHTSRVYAFEDNASASQLLDKLLASEMSLFFHVKGSRRCCLEQPFGSH